MDELCWSPFVVLRGTSYVLLDDPPPRPPSDSREAMPAKRVASSFTGRVAPLRASWKAPSRAPQPCALFPPRREARLLPDCSNHGNFSKGTKSSRFSSKSQKPWREIFVTSGSKVLFFPGASDGILMLLDDSSRCVQVLLASGSGRARPESHLQVFAPVDRNNST